MNAWEIIHLPSIRARLRGKGGRPSARSVRKLTLQIAERARLMDVLRRIGLAQHAAEVIYPRREETKDQ